MKIGNGEKTFIWKKNWHPISPLIEKYGDRISYDSGIGINSKVKSMIDGNDWKWPTANTIHLMEMRSIVNFWPSDEEDSFEWLSSKDGDFLIKLA